MDAQQAIKDLVSEEELSELMAGRVAGEEPATGEKLIEQAFHYWEQTVHDLQREVRELRERLEKLERMHEEGRPSLIATGFAKNEPEPAPEPEKVAIYERPTRAEKHRSKGRWF